MVKNTVECFICRKFRIEAKIAKKIQRDCCLGKKIIPLFGRILGICLSFCWSGLHGPIAYSLLVGGVPISDQRLCGTLDSVPLKFKLLRVVPALVSFPMEFKELVSLPPHSTLLHSAALEPF